MKFELKGIRFAYQSNAYGRREVFSDLTLTVATGECVAILGEEGSGKSTLLQLMDGLLRPEAGTVAIGGENVWLAPKHLHAVRRRIGFTFQFPETQFFCETLRDELLFASRNFGATLPDEDVIRSVLGELGLPSLDLSRSPFSLSMGEARRVAIASVLLHRPSACLFDEPTAGLDAFGVEHVLLLLQRLRKEGKTVVIASHDADAVSAVAHRTVVLDRGRIVREILPT